MEITIPKFNALNIIPGNLNLLLTQANVSKQNGIIFIISKVWMARQTSFGHLSKHSSTNTHFIDNMSIGNTK